MRPRSALTPTEFRRARNALGLSIRQLAAMLSLEPEAVRQMEIQIGNGGHRPIRGSTVRLLDAYLNGYRPPDWPVDPAGLENATPMSRVPSDIGA